MTVEPQSQDQELASYRPRLERFFCVRRLGHVAEDLTSEVVARVFATLQRGDRIDHVGAFALGTARHVLLEHYRDRDSRAESLSARHEPAVDPPNGDEDDDRLRWVHSCINQLSRPDRDLFFRYYGDGKNKANRAAMTREFGITANALCIRACRLRAAVRKCVERHLGPVGGP